MGYLGAGWRGYTVIFPSTVSTSVSPGCFHKGCVALWRLFLLKRHLNRQRYTRLTIEVDSNVILPLLMLITSVCRQECGRKPYDSIFKGNSESSGELNINYMILFTCLADLLASYRAF